MRHSFLTRFRRLKMQMYGGQCIYVFDHDNWMLASFYFALFMDLDILSVNEKRGEKERSECPVILTEQALSIKDLSFSKRFRFILKEARMIFLLPEPRKKANCVCSTINPRQSFMFSLFCLSSADFCDSTAGIIEKLLTLLVHSGSQSDLRIRFSFLFPCYGEK